MTYRSQWIGAPIRTDGPAVYYSSVELRGAVFKIDDVVQIERDATEPPPIARILELFERNKKRYLTLEWYYRPRDVLQLIKEVRSDLSKARSEGRANPNEEDEESALHQLTKQINAHTPREIFASNHRQEVALGKIERPVVLASSPNAVPTKSWFCRKWLDVMTMRIAPLKRRAESDPPASQPQRKRARSDTPAEPLPPPEPGRVVTVSREYLASRAASRYGLLASSAHSDSIQDVLQTELRRIESLGAQALASLQLLVQDHRVQLTARMHSIERMVARQEALLSTNDAESD